MPPDQIAQPGKTPHLLVPGAEIVEPRQKASRAGSPAGDGRFPAPPGKTPLDELSRSWHEHHLLERLELISRAEGCVPTQGRGYAVRLARILWSPESPTRGFPAACRQCGGTGRDGSGRPRVVARRFVPASRLSRRRRRTPSRPVPRAPPERPRAVQAGHGRASTTHSRARVSDRTRSTCAHRRAPRRSRA
jgi:hypothetical protein